MSSNSYLLEAAIDSLGIYPAAVIRGDVKTPRDRYGDGWNDALRQIREHHYLLVQWRSEMEVETRKALDYLFEETCLFDVDIDGDTVELGLILNDVFVPAADAKAVEVTDLLLLRSLYERFNVEGLYAWASKDYKVSPRGVDEPRYRAALEVVHAS